MAVFLGMGTMIEAFRHYCEYDNKHFEFEIIIIVLVDDLTKGKDLGLFMMF